MRDNELLINKMQDAACDYSAETGELDFTAVVEVRCIAGWTQKPNVVLLGEPIITTDFLPYWLNVASQAIATAINAVARVPGVTPELTNCLNKTTMELSTVLQDFKTAISDNKDRLH